jgi:acetyl esterase/lipase
VAVLALAASCTSAGSTPPPPTGTGAVPQLFGGQSATVTYCNHEKARITEPQDIEGGDPVALYVHGGSWVSGNLDTGGFLINEIGPALERAGFIVMSIDYRLGPATPWPAQIEDVKCAVRYLRANAGILNVNPDEIGAWGQSAGGHLVSLLGTAGPSAGWDVGAYTDESSKIQAVVDMAGPTDLLTMGSQGDSGIVQDSFISLLGSIAPQRLGAALKAASPVTYVAKGDPPFLILHSNNDQIVYPQQSDELTWDLAANDAPNQLVMVNGGGHEFDDPGASPDEAQITTMIVKFFTEHLHPHH